VTLDIIASDPSGVGEMQFSNDGTSWSAPEPYATTKSWMLDPGDGTKTVYVKLKDNVGNWSGAYSDSIILDTVGPAVFITSPAPGAGANRTPVLTYTASDGTVVVKVDGLVVGKVSGDTIDSLADGFHVVQVQSTDNAGNISFAETAFTIDTVAPVVTITSPTAGLTNSRTPVLTYSVSEGTQVVSVDGVVITKASGDTLGPLADGPHTVKVEATDAAGNAAFAEVGFTVDATAPTVTITSPTVGYTNNRTPILSFTVSEGTAVVTVDGVVLPLLSGDTLGQLADGPHTVRVDTTDAAGNPGFAEVSFAVDTLAPAVTISTPATGFSNNSRPVLNYTASEGTVVVKVDGVVVGKVSGDALDALNDGLHVVRVESTDNALNKGFAETTFTIDTIAPVVTITSPLSGPTNNIPALAFSVSDGTVVVKVDGVAVSKVSGDTLDLLTNGGHTVRVEATDVAGNIGYSEVGFSVESYSVTLNAGDNGTVTGPATVIYGGSAGYTITPATGYHVADVQVDGVSVGAVSSYNLNNVTANHTISASFAINSYTITATAGANGDISGAGPVSVNYGGTVFYTSIIPAVGYHIADVLVDGASVGAVTSYSFANVTANHTISATFATNSFAITMNAGASGTISGPATVKYGDNPTYSFTPNIGYHVADVTFNGASFGALTSYTFLSGVSGINANLTIAAVFAIDTFKVTMNSGANGSISGSSTAIYGSSAGYTITPAVGYHVADVLLDGVSVGAVTSYTFTNVTTNHTISASFAINSYNITAMAGANGSISGPATVNYSGSASYTITPAVGYHVANVLVDGASVDAVTSYNFTNITANHTISASFAINSFNITATAGANGSISGPATVTYGGIASYSITPAAGYRVANVLVDGVSVGAVTSYSLSNVTANHTISATFAALADLVATSVTGPGSVNRGKSISVSSNVGNQGGTNAGSFTVAFYLSKDTTVNSSDTLLGTKTVTSLNAGSTTTVSGSFTVPSGMSTGNYYVGVIVDSGSAIVEANESNNSKAAGSLTTVR
jgi:hypothetical protein